MLKITAYVLLITISAAVTGCTTAQKCDTCCDDMGNNGKAVVTNQAKPNSGTMPSTQPTEHQH